MKKLKNVFLRLLLLHILIAKGNQEIILQRCLPKADMENITIKCAINEVIAIKEAFFTSSVVDQCPFINGNESISHSGKSSSSSEESSKNDINNNLVMSCTDDLRLTLNSKCSGHSACSVNLRKLHIHQCSGYDGWINLKYACVAKSKLNSYCNIQLTDSLGYVSNPGYPKFYPPYDCKWKIVGYAGQRIQIEILDLSVKEPRYTSKKPTNYECTDNVAIIEDGVKLMNFCGETKSNLIEHRSKSNELVIEFHSYEFSPTRGLLFRYTMIDCPTLKPPSNGYMYRNQSYAYYSCYFDYVFEDTGQQTKTLFCQYETYWNGTVTRCVAKENSTEDEDNDDDVDLVNDGQKEKAYALSHASIKAAGRDENDDSQYNDENDDHGQPPLIQEIDQLLLKPITFIIIGIIALCVIATIIGMLIHSNRNSYITNISI